MVQNDTFKITGNDLTGCIKYYPIEIVELMITRIEDEHGTHKSINEPLDLLISCPSIAFVWENTPEGPEFWRSVIIDKNFDVFFEKYPKAPIDPERVYVIQDGTYKPDDIIKTLEAHGGINSNRVIGSASDTVYYIMPISGAINWVRRGVNSEYDEFLKALNYKKIDVEVSPIEISKGEILEALGLNPCTNIVVID